MPFCKACGAEHSEGCKFCSECGNPLQTGTRSKKGDKNILHPSSTSDNFIDKIIKINRYIFSDEKHILITPFIDEKKANNAIKRYANKITLSDILILIDDTVFGSAKDGLILTKDKIFFHQFLTDPRWFPLEDIEHIELNDKKFYISGKEIFTCILPKIESLESFITIVNEILEVKKYFNQQNI
jgi:hypothetical protein